MRTELHFHLLPGVDDGPRTEAEAIALARLAVADGTGVVCATPHAAFIDPFEVADRVASLQAALDRAGVALRVLTGSELLPAEALRFDADELELIAQGPAGRRWVLLEAPLDGDLDGGMFDALARLQRFGYGVLIAHPERSPGWWDDTLDLDLARAAGARLQVNASSITGFHGPRAHRRALSLLRAGRVAALASDAHHLDRPPRLTEALAELAHDGIDARALVEGAPLTRGLPPLRLVTRGQVS